MALPKINEFPSYELVIPSTKQPINFRPFLVKEQKILLMALETQDEKQILKAIVDTIESCAQNPIDIGKLATFDIEYLFTQIRAKSVGETANLMINCSKCEGQTEVSVPLDQIKVDVDVNSNMIKLNDHYTLQLKYPTYEGILLAPEGKEGDKLADAIYEMIVLCLDRLHTDEELISFSDESRESIDAFLDNLDTKQFDMIMKFVNSLPKLSHEIHFDCSSCGFPNKVRLQGIQDFF